MKKKSPYFPSLRWKSLKLRESGVLETAIHANLAGEPNCNPILKQAKSLGLRKIFTLFLILVTGTTSGLFILGFELKFKKNLVNEKSKEEQENDKETMLEQRVVRSTKILYTKLFSKDTYKNKTLDGMSFNEALKLIEDIVSQN